MNTLISIAPLQGDYLAHHQIKGAHWGILHGPPYPLARGKGPKKIKKASKEAIKRVDKQAEEGVPGAEKKKAELRKYIVEHPNKLYKHKEMFSKEELEDILKEIDFDRKLKDVKRNEFSRFVSDVRDVANLAISVKNITGSAVDIYKSANTIGDILAKRGEFASKQDSSKSESKPKTEDKPKQESSKKSFEAEQKERKERNQKAKEEAQKSSNKQSHTDADYTVINGEPKRSKSSNNEPLNGTVLGSGSSSNKSAPRSNVIDVDFTEINSGENKRRTARGKSFLDRMVQPQSDSYMSSMLRGNPSFAHSDKN